MPSASSLPVAVVIPCYNAAPWIDRTIGSVLDQNCHDLQVIVVDDGSTDDSVARAQSFGGRVTVLTGPNRGACHARNRGLERAIADGAEYILFLDADDHFEGNMLGEAVSTAVATGADMVLSDMHKVYANGQREERFLYHGRITPETLFKGWLTGGYFNPSAILWRTGFIRQIGGWDETLIRAQDTDFSLRALFHAPLIMKNDHGAAIYNRVNRSSLSLGQSQKALDSQMRVFLGLIDRARNTAFAPFIPQMTETIYSITLTAFRNGQVELGRRGLRELRALGFRRNPGSFPHRILSGVIGLEAKVRLWGS